MERAFIGLHSNLQSVFCEIKNAFPNGPNLSHAALSGSSIRPAVNRDTDSTYLETQHVDHLAYRGPREYCEV